MKKNPKRDGEHTMKTYEIQSLPEVRFAHIYHTSTYQNAFPIQDDRMEISYISEGEITVECRGKEYVAKKGDIICLPYHPHAIRVCAKGYHEHRTVQARVKWREQDSINGLLLPIVTSSALHTKTAAAMIEQMISDPLLFKESPTKGAILFLELLAEIDRCHRNAEKIKLPSDIRYATRAKEYVQRHMGLPITQKSVAEYLSISPEYLCAVFKKTEGMTFVKYVNSEKLSAMKKLMEKEHVHLYEAAAHFGYNDPNYVSRLFKRYYGYNITNVKNE